MTTTTTLNSKIPAGPIAEKWDTYKADMKLVNPNNKRKFKVIVVGTGLAGASAAATLAELGYQVDAFTFHDSARRAHSIAAQGGINAAKNYKGDGDSVHRLFYDTVKGGDFRAREYNVYRLAQNSVNIIDQAVAQGVPFAREYGGTLANRSFGGAQVSRTFYARGQTGQQLLLGAYQALERQVDAGRVQMFPRHDMLDLIVIDGRARGIVTRNMVTGAIETHLADAVILGTGGYGNVYYLSTNAKGSNCTAIWRAYKRGAAFGTLQVRHQRRNRKTRNLQRAPGHFLSVGELRQDFFRWRICAVPYCPPHSNRRGPSTQNRHRHRSAHTSPPRCWSQRRTVQAS